MNYKAITVILCISLISSSTLFVKDEKNTETKSHEKSQTIPKPKDTKHYVKYSSFGDFFYDEDAIDMTTEMG